MLILLATQMVGCSCKLLSSVSGDLSKAATNTAVMMVDQQTEKIVKSKKSPTQAKIGAGTPETATLSNLQDNPSFGKQYLKKMQSTQILNYSGQYTDRWTGTVSQLEGNCLQVTTRLEAVASNSEKDMLPQSVQFEEDVSTFGEISWKLRACAWFRIKRDDSGNIPSPNSRACIIRGFDGTGKCIFYRELEYFPDGLHPKESTKPTPVESVSKPKVRITVPKMIKPS